MSKFKFSVGPWNVHTGADSYGPDARGVKKLLDKYGLKAEFVAPRLWMDPHTKDGGFMSTCAEDREFAMWRAYRSIDIANEQGCDMLVLWLARYDYAYANKLIAERKFEQLEMYTMNLIMGLV